MSTRDEKSCSIIASAEDEKVSGPQPLFRCGTIPPLSKAQLIPKKTHLGQMASFKEQAHAMFKKDLWSLYAQCIVGVIVAYVFAVLVDWLIPAPHRLETVWRTRTLLIIQLFLDVTIVFLFLTFANSVGLMKQDGPVGIVVFVLVVTVFFTAQQQLGQRMESLYLRLNRGFPRPPRPFTPQPHLTVAVPSA